MAGCPTRKSRVSKAAILSLINRLITSSNPLARLVVYSEWCLLALTIVLQTLAYAFLQPTHEHLRVDLCLVILAILAMTSIYLPERRPYLYRVAFLCFELSLISATFVVGISRWTWPLYLVLIARASLLLNKRDVWFMVILACIIQAGLYMLKFSTETSEGILKGFIVSNLMAALVLTSSYAALTIVVAWWMQTLQSEQQLRRKAEELAVENQQLAGALERSRIAREIHDSLGHTLTSLKVQLEVARRLFDRDVNKAKEAVEQAEELAARSLTDTRVALQSIRNSDFDFENAVGELVRDAQAQGALSISCNLSSHRLSNAAAYQLYRVVQECLTNSMKHAQASEVLIKLEEHGQRVHLEVTDNGVGFDPAEVGDGLGIRGIKERITSLSGTVELESKRAAGTKLLVTVPL